MYYNHCYNESLNNCKLRRIYSAFFGKEYSYSLAYIEHMEI